MSEDVWSAQDTTPTDIESALRKLLGHRYQEDRSFVPARVMNLVVIVDRGFRGEVENRLARVGRYHPSRLVIAAVEEGRTAIDAWATVAAEDADHAPGHIAVGRERDAHGPLPAYEAGSAGPAEADALLGPGREWRKL